MRTDDVFAEHSSGGIFIGTFARTTPQFALLLLLVLLPRQMLSGGLTPRESMPLLAQKVMDFAPTTHFVSISQAVLFHGAGLQVIWPQLLALDAIGALLSLASHTHFRKSIGQMA